MPSPPTIADRLLDAQVAWALEELTGDRLPVVITREVDGLLARAGQVRLVDVVDAEALVAVLGLLARTLPDSVAAAAVAEDLADVVHAGPTEPVRPSQLLDRRLVAALVDALLPLRPLLAQQLDRLTASASVGTLASRFVTRLVLDVLEANRSLTRRIPGVGGLLSMGSSVATMAVGAADRQVQALFGDTAGKGAALAVRRLNSVLLGTLDDPLLADAVLEVWDATADEPLDGIDDVVDRDDLRRLASVLQRALARAVRSEPALALADAALEDVLSRWGDAPLAVLLDDLGLDRDDVLELALTLVPPLVAAAAADGWLEQLVRDRLAPFWDSPGVAAVLDA
jgi:hypothetical protein